MSERRTTNTKETPKLQRIFEHQRRQERRQPKRTKMASGTVTNTDRRQKLQRRCNELTRSCACSRRSGDRSCCIGLGTVWLRRGHVGRAKLERDQTKSNKIKRNQDLTLASPRVCPCLKLMYLSSHCQTFSIGTDTTVKVRLQEIVGSDRSLQKYQNLIDGPIPFTSEAHFRSHDVLLQGQTKSNEGFLGPMEKGSPCFGR